MRRSALPSYALDAAAAAPAGRHTRWWLLFYVVLGFYALTVLGSFVVGWAPQPPAPQQQQQVLLQQQRTVVDAAPVKVGTTDSNEPEEGWPAQELNGGETEEREMQRELEQQQEQQQEPQQQEGAAEDENAAAEVTTPALSELATATPSPTTTTPATTSPSTPEVQILAEKNVEIPTRQNDVVLVAANEDETRQEQPTPEPSETKASSQEGDEVKNPNQAEAEMQAPQEEWEVADSSKDEAAETPGPLATPMNAVTRPPVRRSHEFLQAMYLVHLPETKPPNPYFHVFPVGKDLPGEQAALVAGLRNNAADRDTWSVEGYQHEVDRLEGLKNEAKEETERLKLLIGATDKLIAEEKDRLEDKRAASTLDIRKHQPRKIRNRLKCMGWRQTGQCDPYGKREPNADLACNQIAQGGVSGYCEVLDEDTGELFRVMQLNCSSVRDHVVFSCAEAADFANFGLMAQGVYENALAQNESNPAKLLGNNGTGNGIVMVVYPKLLSSVFASISVLRSYNCTLPIELWISQPEVVRTPSMRPTLEMLQQRFANVTVETIIDPTIAGFSTKIHAVQHSKFENVLFLDADNVPVRDPTFLFESNEFLEHGAIFWPDFWHPEKTIFNIQRESLLWELVDLPFVDMFEQESGQVLINRKRAALALEVLMFYAYHRPSHFERLVLAHGDKDLFRLAWMKTHTPYYMMPFPPAAAGVERGTYKKQFCEVSVGDGEEIMFPANRTAVQRMMSYEDIKKKYQIGIQPSGALFKEFESCYGAEANVIGNYNLTKFEDLPFANLEQELIDYAHEGALLMAQAQGRMRYCALSTSAMVLLRLLSLLLLLLPLASAQQCAHFAQDDLLSRLETRVPKCLGACVSSSALSTLTERFVANDFDRRQPLALVLFSNSSDLLHALAGAVGSSLFGTSRSPHTVQRVDFRALLEPARASNYDIKQTLRSALTGPLRACPERSLFVLDNVQALDDSALPVLDVFLDPLNGKRAQFQHYVEGKASRVYDCANSVFLFLYKVTASLSPLDGGESGPGSTSKWREFLMQQWTRAEGTLEEFTPQAFVGRLTDALAVFPPESEDSIDESYEEFKKTREWRQMCELQTIEKEDRDAQADSSSGDFGGAAMSLVAENVAAAAPMIPGALVMLSIPAYLLILTRAKRWNGEITKQRERGTIHRRSGGSNNRRKKRKTRSK
ncbi:hypothetical protein PHYSODRAFT_315438 [Phytophthora sojae]|uniref:Nucleotide-diphospho-sugar transferase n=1 Tax=Phytophthora sojae (strain P6497) TaxID=1094619 RepID=G4ZDT7_PHYSP|nr:hypothetical protein PHYSODRAFT_315438 [Phytophthora sojae]EGZ19016.1 hypothetical protein PHYSODRAFT_315438 [Phytophthora sojae]|eukprot:XP_009528074.1 hypothetical protein PHYSODRAFT_315438 [Phytophthora sojae]